MAPNSLQRIWTVPNVLSFSRLALLPVFLWLVSRSDRKYWIWAGVVVVYGILSDILDGILARKLGQVTQLGKLVDPLADKITAGVVGIFCVVGRGMPAGALVLMVVRDLTILLAGRLIWKKSREVPTSMFVGKIAALLWGVTLLLWVFDWQPMAGYVLWPTVSLYLLAGVLYAWRVIKS